MVLSSKVIVLKEESATFFHQFIETLVVMLIIFLKKDMCYLKKARVFFEFRKIMWNVQTCFFAVDESNS